MKKWMLCAVATAITCAANAVPITWTVTADNDGYAYWGVLLQRPPAWPEGVTINPKGEIMILDSGVVDIQPLVIGLNTFQTNFD